MRNTEYVKKVNTQQQQNSKHRIPCLRWELNPIPLALHLVCYGKIIHRLSMVLK